MNRRTEPLPLLAPLGWIYLTLSAAHHRLYDLGWRPVERASVPVISIGNITAGGVGKTPATIWLAERLASPDRCVAVVSRGYRGVREEDPLLVGKNGRAMAAAGQAGDEPVMIARSGAAGLVIVGRDRAAAARLAVAHGADVVILDDGFQHRRLARELDLVLVDHDDPLGGGRGLPAGWLREGPGALARAGLLLLTRCPAPLAERETALVREELPLSLAVALDRLPPANRPPVFASSHRVSGFLDSEGKDRQPEWLRDRTVVAACGIARPEGFFATLEQLGARVARKLPWPDHHAFDNLDARKILEAIEESGAQAVVTTEKDAVRWPPAAPRPCVLRIGLRIGAERAVIEHVSSALSRRGSAEN